MLLHIPSPKYDTTYDLIHKGFSQHIKPFAKSRWINLLKPSRAKPRRSQSNEGNIMTVGATRSGKSRRFVMPALRRWGGSVFCVDMKSELYENTKDTRPNIRVFDPNDPLSYGFDPFDILNETDNQAQEAEAISAALIPLPHHVGDNAFFIYSARDLLTGFLLHFHKEKISFVDAMAETLLPPKGLRELIEDIYNNSESGEARFYLSAFISMPEKTLGNVQAELKQHITVFTTDKALKCCLSREKNISPSDLDNGDDVYLCINQKLLQQWKPLLTLIVSRFMRHFQDREDRKGRPVLMMLDEFSELGKIEGIDSAFATLGSKNVTICAVVQSLAQLDRTYGEAIRRVIVDNCPYIVVFPLIDADSQQYFHRLFGGRDRWRRSYGVGASPSVNLHKERMPLIYPEELATLEDILLLTPEGPFRMKKAPFFVPQKVGSMRIIFPSKPNGKAESNCAIAGGYELTDTEWSQVESLLPPQRTGDKGRAPRDHRMTLSAIRWKARSGKGWRSLPELYGPYQTIHKRFSQWREGGLLETVFKVLGGEAEYQKLTKEPSSGQT